MARTKKQRDRLKRRRQHRPTSEHKTAERRERDKRFETLIAERERKQRRLVAFLLVGIAAVVVVTGWFSPAVPESEKGRVNLFLVFVTGITAGGLSCLAVQGGLLATAVAQREDSDQGCGTWQGVIVPRTYRAAVYSVPASSLNGARACESALKTATKSRFSWSERFK